MYTGELGFCNAKSLYQRICQLITPFNLSPVFSIIFQEVNVINKRTPEHLKWLLDKASLLGESGILENLEGINKMIHSK